MRSRASIALKVVIAAIVEFNRIDCDAFLEIVGFGAPRQLRPIH